MANLLEHLTEFAIPALDEHDLVPGIVDRTRGSPLAD